MKHDVFISHSGLDKHVADAVCSTLENSGIRCWIAPRDILPGSDWAQSIASAIKAGKIMVLIFSHNSNNSPQVSKELNLAVSHNLMIIPFKIDNTSPSGSMEYFLADMHWLDAIDGDMQQIATLKNIDSFIYSCSYAREFIAYFTAIGAILLAIPSVSLCIRRLHDTNRSGWWLLFFLTYYLSFIPIILFLFQGVDEKNRFK